MSLNEFGRNSSGANVKVLLILAGDVDEQPLRNEPDGERPHVEEQHPEVVLGAHKIKLLNHIESSIIQQVGRVKGIAPL